MPWLVHHGRSAFPDGMLANRMPFSVFACSRHDLNLGFMSCHQQGALQVGFQVLDSLASRAGVSLTSARDKALQARGVIAGQQVVLAKPITFMNLSGEAVGKLTRYYKVGICLHGYLHTQTSQIVFASCCCSPAPFGYIDLAELQIELLTALNQFCSHFAAACYCYE